MKTLSLIVHTILIAALLSGCAHQQPKAPLISQDWPLHQAQLLAHPNWQAIGKLAVKVPNDGGSANLNWVQTGKIYQISLNGPFGAGKLDINGEPGSVTLLEAGEPPQTAKTAEELIRKTTGWTIPVTQLAFWVRGLPEPNTRVVGFSPNPQGLIGVLEQLGWKITYGDYLNVPLNPQSNDTPNGSETLAMPGRIVAEYKDVRLTLVIREWRLPAQDKSE